MILWEIDWINKTASKTSNYNGIKTDSNSGNQEEHCVNKTFAKVYQIVMLSLQCRHCLYPNEIDYINIILTVLASHTALLCYNLKVMLCQLQLDPKSISDQLLITEKGSEHFLEKHQNLTKILHIIDSIHSYYS